MVSNCYILNQIARLIIYVTGITIYDFISLNNLTGIESTSGLEFLRASQLLRMAGHSLQTHLLPPPPLQRSVTQSARGRRVLPPLLRPFASGLWTLYLSSHSYEAYSSLWKLLIGCLLACFPFPLYIRFDFHHGTCEFETMEESFWKHRKKLKADFFSHFSLRLEARMSHTLQLPSQICVKLLMFSMPYLRTA